VLASTDWVAIASVGTAVATLVLAIATFSSVRSANRTARAAERSLAAQLWPLLAPTRPDDPEQKVVFRDGHKVVVGGGMAAVEAADDAIYFLISVRNVGPGLAVLDQWWFGGRRLLGAEAHADESSYRRLGRDQYIPSGEIGFLQAAIRDPSDPDFAAAATAIAAHQEMTVDVLYTDHLGHQRTITRFVLNPMPSGGWYAVVPRHWYLDRPDPRPHDDE
jgi:hypothetical protein